jgi:hypothetical protein
VGSLGMHHLQSQYFLESIEVVIAVQELVARLQTERSDQAIDGGVYGVTAPAQASIVLRGYDCGVCATRGENVELEKIGSNLRKDRVMGALQDFAQNQVSQSQRLLLQLALQPSGFRIVAAAKIVNPDGSVDDHHK